MRAAVLTGFNEPLAIEELRSPDLGDHEVRVAVDASGVCHSDLSVQKGNVPMPPPIILGHEGSGIVIEVGSAVSRVKKGDRIIASFGAVCGNCWYCLHDKTNLCDTTMEVAGRVRAYRGDGSEVRAMTGLGTFSDLMVLSETNAVPVHTDLPPEQLALIGCGITTGVGAALNTGKVTPGATVAVFGCGGVGQSVIQGARICGASRIFAVDPVELKRSAAGHFGATDFIDPANGDPVAQIIEATGGLGVDFSFEVIGLPETIVAAYNVVRRAGTAVIVGMPRYDAAITLPAFGIFASEKVLVGSMYGSSQVRRDFQRYIELVETGRLDIGSMISRRISLDEVNDAFRAMEAGEVIRSVITSW
jgi:S-(hydroxymethyl)glutathione dehydrogenase/alcohol dehydrogenase